MAGTGKLAFCILSERKKYSGKIFVLHYEIPEGLRETHHQVDLAVDPLLLFESGEEGLELRKDDCRKISEESYVI